MTQLLPLSLLFPLSIPALAQQPDTLAARRVGVITLLPDSLSAPSSFLSGRLVCTGVGVSVTQISYLPLLPTLSLQEQLRQIAGVQATPYSGAPGAQVAVRIRGAASMSGNAQPLYVVDGIPVFQNTFTPPATTNSYRFVAAEAVELDVNPLLSIPTADIESVQVLKGALETAQYGSQGINGVIRITTKRGQTGPLRLRYSGYGGVQQARTRYKLLNAQQYATLVNEINVKDNQRPRFSPAQLAALGTGTDWQEELLRTAATQEHHLSADGGFAKTRYYVGADYLQQQGIELNSKLSRYALRANLDQQIGQRLHFSASATLSETRQRLPAYYALPNALFADPTLPARDAAGNYPSGPYNVNPVRAALESYRAPQQQRLLTQFGVRYNLVTGLSLDVRGNLERATLNNTSFSPPFGSLPGGQVGDYKATYEQWVLNPALRYAHTLGNGNQHKVSASLEAMPQRRTFEEASNTYSPDRQYQTSRGSAYKANLAAYLLTADYTFAERYQLQASLRRDASSSFILEERWQWLPGAQATWHASKEAFLQSSQVISSLDLWAGWGLTSGASNLGRNYYLVFAPNGPDLNNQIRVVQRELTQQLEAGVRTGLWGNHLTVALEAYTRRTDASGQYIAGVPLSKPDTFVHNAGLELSVWGSWQAGELRGMTTLAAAVNRNRYHQARGGAGSATTFQRLYDGQPLGTFYGPRYTGVNAVGAPTFQDVNADGSFGYLDFQPLGSGLPRQLLSLSQQLSYGRFTLQAQLDGMFGYQVNNAALYLLDSPTNTSNASTRVLDRWTPANLTTEVPASSSALRLPEMSSYSLQSGNHARLSSLTLACKVWEKGPRNVSVWAGGHNLFVLSKYRGYDPNVSSAGSNNLQPGLDDGAYPVARTILVGVRATL